MSEVTADTIVVELQARLGEYDAQINASASNFEDNMRRTTAAAAGAESAANSAFSAIAQQAMAAGGAVEQFTVNDLRAAQAVGELIVAMQQMASQAQVVTAEELQAAQGVAAFARAFGQSATDVVGHSNRVGVSQQIMMHIVRGSTDQFAAGAPPVQILTMHMGMLAEAAAYSGGSLGKLSTFMSGPWGLALTAGITILATLAAGHHEAGDAATQHKDIEHLLTAALNGEHDALQKLTEAIKQKNEAAHESIQSDRERKDAALAAAQADYKATLAARERLAVDLARKRQELKAQINAGPQTDPSTHVDINTFAIEAAQKRLATTESLIAANDAALKGLRDTLISRIVDTNKDRSEHLVDPDKAITRHYDDRVAAANKTLAAVLDKQGLTMAARRAAEAAYTKAIQHATDVQEQETKDLQESRRKGKRTDTDLVDFGSPLHGGLHPSHPFGEQRPGHAHGGVDLPASPGTPIYAPYGGVVQRARTAGKYGNLLELSHGRGTLTRYGHLSEFAVEEGAEVEKGQLIGYTGGAKGAPGSGNSTGPHLHYEVRVGGRGVDPTKGKFPADTASTEETAEQKAEQRQEREARNAKQFTDQLAALNAQILQARKGQTSSAEEQEQYDEETIIAARDRRNVDYELAAQGKDMTATERKVAVARGAILTAASNELAQEQIAQVERRKRARLDKEATAAGERHLREQEADITNARDLYQAQGALATTAKTRREVEMALLDLQFDEERLRLRSILDQTERVRTSETATAEEKKDAETQARIAQTRLGILGSLQRSSREAVDRRNETPLQTYRREVKEGGNTINEDMEGIAVNGIRALNDGLADAIANSKSLADVFHNVANQILADLLRIIIRQVIVKSLMGLISGNGGSGGFGDFKVSDGDMPLAFAEGGRPPVGRASIIGERGPELWVPDAAGTIYPANKRASLGQQQGMSLVRIEVASGEMFDARVMRLSGDVAVETVRVAAPHLTELAVGETARRFGREGT